MQRLRRAVGSLGYGAALALGGVWTSLAVATSPWLGGPAWLGAALGAATLAGLGLWLHRRRAEPRWRQVLVPAAVFAVVLVEFVLREPSNRREWAPSARVLADASLAGSRARITGFRNAVHRTREDVDWIYEERDVDLERVEGVDLVVSYWEGHERVAHTLLSFRLEDAAPVCVSVEVRCEEGERYGAVRGLFKQFELLYVVGDERDLIGSRVLQRGEDVYLFPLAARPDQARALLEHVLRRVHELNATPRWYGTLGQNCTTSLIEHVNAIWPEDTPFTERLIMNGYAPRHAYELGLLASDLPFDELFAASCVNDAVREAAGRPEFSRELRRGLPGP